MKLEKGIGTIRAWVNGDWRAHIEIALWRRRDGRIFVGTKSVRFQVVILSVLSA
jgi:hypothetical protein